MRLSKAEGRRQRDNPEYLTLLQILNVLTFISTAIYEFGLKSNQFNEGRYYLGTIALRSSQRN